MAYVTIPKITTTDGTVTQFSKTVNDTYGQMSVFIPAGAFDLLSLYNSMSVNETRVFATISPTNVQLLLKKESDNAFRISANPDTGTRLCSWSGNPNFTRTILAFAFVYNSSTDKYSVICFYPKGDPTLCNYSVNEDPTIDSRVRTILAGAIPPEHTWAPFTRLTGNNGQFQMDLSQISAAVIGDGETQTGDSDASHFTITPRSSLYNMSVNMLDGQEYTIAYCGDNYLTCTKRTVVGSQSTSINLTLKFYFRSDVLIYTCPEISITRVGTTAPNDYYLSIIYDADNEVAAPDLINEINVLGSNVYYYNNFSLPSETQLSALYIWLQDNGNAQSGGPYDTGSTDNGGDPEGNRLQDNLTDSTPPTCGGLDLGLITLYRPTDTQLRAIAQFLWSDNVLDNFKKYFNNFADNIISLYSLPYTPSGLLTKTFTVGNMTSEITNVEYCSVRYFDIDMGQVEIKNKWGSYLDYSPYTKIEVYLPYLGLHSLDTDELMSPTRLDGSMPDTQGTVLSLVYRLDIMTGIIVAKIKVRVYNKNGSYTDQIRYQFSGRVGSICPLTGQTFAGYIQTAAVEFTGLVTTIASGGLTAPMAGAAAVTATVAAQKPTVERVGSVTGDASMMATNVPYICITVPNKPLLENQQKFTGFPSYKSGLLSDFSGYTEVIDAHVEGISCTEEERTKILQYLKEGVIL